MTLRTRILLGYGYLIGLLLLSVSVAAINSQRVAGNAKQILERNIRTLTQAITMLEQLERQDSETLLALLQPTTGTRLEEAERSFEAAMIAATEEVQSQDAADEDRTTLAAVRGNFEDYRKARAELLSRVYDDPLSAAEDYRSSTQSALMLLKAELNGYVSRKTESLKQANDEASRSAVEGAVLLGVMVTVALLSLGFLSRSLQRDVLGRLTEVGHVTEAIAAGDRRRRVRDFYQDELGLVARQLNAALDRQQELESQMQGRLLEQRRVLVGLMNQWPTPAGMIGIDGELVAATLTPEDEAELHRLTPRVRIAAKVLMTRRFVKAEELAVDIKAGDGRRVVQIRALASGDNQIAGWLASFVDPKASAEASGVYPIPREPSGLMPAPREPSGVFPIPPSALGSVGAENSGVRPMVRPVSGALVGARSGPMRAAASRESSEERTAAASLASMAVNEAMLGEPSTLTPPMLGSVAASTKPTLAPAADAPSTTPTVASVEAGQVEAPVTAPRVEAGQVEAPITAPRFDAPASRVVPPPLPPPVVAPPPVSPPPAIAHPPAVAPARDPDEPT